MKTAFKKSFLKKLKTIKDQNLKNRITKAIIQVEKSNHVSEIQGLKKLKGFENYYRVRIGNYRIGVHIKNNLVYFVTFSHRKNIYKEFP